MSQRVPYEVVHGPDNLPPPRVKPIPDKGVRWLYVKGSPVPYPTKCLNEDGMPKCAFLTAESVENELNSPNNANPQLSLLAAPEPSVSKVEEQQVGAMLKDRIEQVKSCGPAACIYSCVGELIKQTGLQR